MTGVSGAWRISSVRVDSQEVVDPDFDVLFVSGDRIAIEPAGIELSVNQSTSHSAILQSRSDVYFAEFSRRENQLTLEFSRPAFRQKIRLNAQLN